MDHGCLAGVWTAPSRAEKLGIRTRCSHLENWTFFVPPVSVSVVRCLRLGSTGKYVRRACEPRICIMWTSSSSSHVAILVNQVVPVLSHLEVLLFSVSTLRQKRSSCPSIGFLSLDPAYAARITWNIGDIVECQHVDYEGNPQEHSVSLVDSATANGGFNVKTLVGFSFARC